MLVAVSELQTVEKDTVVRSATNDRVGGLKTASKEGAVRLSRAEPSGRECPIPISSVPGRQRRSRPRTVGPRVI